MSGFDPNSPADNLVPREVPPSTTVNIPRYGDPYPASLDPQPIGLLQSSTIVTLLTGAGAAAVACGVRWTLTDAQAQQIADGVIALLAIVVPIVGAYLRTRAASVVKTGASAPPAVRMVAKARRDAAKSATSRIIPFALALGGALAVGVTSVGCAALGGASGTATTQPALMSPAVRVAVARQVYTGVLPALTQAIDNGMFDSSPDTLRAIASTRAVLENALNQADALADSGRATDFNFWIAQVDATLAEFLKLTKPGTRAIPVPRPTTRPAARPTGLNESEAELWDPWKSPRYSRVLPAWAVPSPERSPHFTPGASCPTISAPQSARPKPWRNTRTIARSATH